MPNSYLIYIQHKNKEFLIAIIHDCSTPEMAICQARDQYLTPNQIHAITEVRAIAINEVPVFEEFVR